MCTTERSAASPIRAGRDGFSLVELILGLALASLIIAVTAPLWVNLQRSGAEQADRTIFLLQQRVAAARFERDLRIVSADGCRFATSGAVLEASPSQVVFLVRSAQNGLPTLVEWEIARGALMRRWGSCPPARPSVYSHALYRDNKTILEGLGDGSGFTYVVDGLAVTGPSSGWDLARVEAVVLRVAEPGGVSGRAGEMTIFGRVGR